MCRRPEGSEERKSTKAPTSPQIVIVSSIQALSFSSSHYHSFLLFTINQGSTNKAEPSNSVAPPQIWAPRKSPTVVRDAAPAIGLAMRIPIRHPADAMPSLAPTLPCSVPGDSTGTMTVVSVMMIPDSKPNTTQEMMNSRGYRRPYTRAPRSLLLPMPARGPRWQRRVLGTNLERAFR